ncbi:hypothetical protein [Campylobacter devanensis]|uniref:hypothetical protein n=2 Tax=Campylobacter devanensis TaxID=3161138 RepID=UPI000A33BFC4|nr:MULTISPECIES: hypothetical protein [unclassified Campylobacter]
MNIFSSVLFHLPHDSSRVPAWCKEQFMLSKVAFKKELILMRDYKTKALFSFDKHQKGYVLGFLGWLWMWRDFAVMNKK